MKASLTALDFAALIREKLAGVEGLRLQKAWGVGGGLALRLREPLAGERVLVLNPSLGVFETKFELPRGELPTQLAAALKGLRGMKLECIRQLNLDRVALLTFERGERRVELVVEWVREGNVLAVEAGRIAAALRQKELRDRRVVVGEVYQPPPPRGLDPLSLTPLDAVTPQKQGVTAAAYLSRLINAPGEAVVEALHRAGLNPFEDASKLASDRLWGAMRELEGIYMKVLRGELEPCIAFEEGEAVAAYPISLSHLPSPLEPVGSFAEAVDRVFTPRLLQPPKPREGGAAEAEQLAREFAEKAAALRRAAERIMAETGWVDEILATFRELKSSLRWDLLPPELKSRYPVVSGVDPAKGRVRVLVDGVEVELEASLSAARNASLFFERAKELERKAERAARVAAEIKPEPQPQSVLKPRREKRWYESFHYFISSEGFLVIGGRDASQNEAIVRKYLGSGDIFLHADIHGGPAVAVKAGGKQVGEATLREAAQLAASYSRAWELGLASVDVYWVGSEQVSKKAPAGEYLGTGAFMVYGKRNYIRGVKLELAVGVKIAGDSYELLAGPPSALERGCESIVVVEPGRVPREEAAEKIAGALSSALRAMGLRARIPRHLVLQLLPKGGFYIAGVRGKG